MIYPELFLQFLQIGAFTFGGGLVILKFVQDAVLANGWITDPNLFINFVAISESTPGPFAINIATYVGNVMGGVFGAFCATLGVVLPSFVIILIVAKCYDRFKNNFYVQNAMCGLKPAAVGLIAAAVLSFFLTVFFPSGLTLAVFSTPDFWVALGIFAVATLLAFRKAHPVFIIALSAVCGILYSFVPGVNF
ncbi:MAG: chromate transporter [Clostridia bacterium]|nr:chromate transporter [Clostridia bacterium]